MNIFLLGAGVMLAEMILQALWIRREGTVVQEQKSYGPMIDVEKKSSTPTMGGIAFLAAAGALCASGWGDCRIWLFAAACGVIGLIDDGLKFFRRSSEGFSSLRKLCAQAAVSSVYAVYISANYDVELWRGFLSPWLAVPLMIFLSVGLQNAVNVTDGLDGLAAGLAALSFAALAFCAGGFTLDIAAALGLALGFLWHNGHPARVFMGDVGSHFLAGLLFALTLFNGPMLLLLPLSFMFGIEMITVTAQIAAIRKFRRRIFKMAPLHHHFQLSGWRETEIVNRFYIAHICGMALLYALLSGAL